MGIAGEGQYFGVVEQEVNHGRGDQVVGERLAPPSEWEVRCHQDATLFVSEGDELKEQVRGVVVEGTSPTSSMTMTVSL